MFSGNERAIIIETENGYEIICSSVDFFVHFFDLETDYDKIKQKLSKNTLMKNAIKFGKGIRIVRNDVFETTISFIISANNNIKRIQKTLLLLRKELGERLGNYYGFPSYEVLKNQNEDYFKSIGCGYRSKQIVKFLQQTNPQKLESWKNLETKELKKELTKLSGIGPKVADCVLLFGYSKPDVFPVDTWIEKVYNLYFGQEKNREIIRDNLVKKFKNLSGYAQQYLFYYQREFKNHH